MLSAWETFVPGTEKKKLREKIAEELLPEKMEEQQLMDAGNPVLPWDMIVEILSWLPPKSLCRFTSVSKPWKSLVYNPNFVKFHFKKSSENKDAFFRRRRVMFTMPDGNSIYSLNLGNLLLSYDENYSDIGDLVAPEIDLVRTEFPCGRIEDLLYCEGFLLCELGKPEQLYLVNPATGEAKKLPEGPKYLDHKGVYSLKTDSWRVVKSPIQYNDADTTHGVLLNGSVHWVMTKVGKESSPVIVSFHLAEEEFREIPLPLKGSGFIPNEYYVLGVFRYCLCLTRCDDFKIHDEFWVMKHYGIRQSWTNIKTSFRYSELYHTSFWKDSHDLLLLDCQFVMYDFNKKSFRNLSVREFLEFENAGIYMESLVSSNYYGGLDPEHEI
ncbi:hypothetical protein DVH24_003199 [Malus domestica]|uniref:F-box domain-containing protein n=1 Tax=Malus domestica TaxID=3750 RepID=A0A498IMK1_MALDO|nr:hypothetical protein DVH24_003199 [Malus domestica]